MVVLVQVLDISIYASSSLKDKRKVLQRIKSVVKNRYNVSIVESARQDSRSSAELTLAMVAPDKTFARKNFDAIIKLIEEKGEAEVTGTCLSEMPLCDKA